MKSTLLKHTTPLHLFFIFTLFISLLSSASEPIQISQSPKEDDRSWLNPFKSWDDYNRKDEIENGSRKFWLFGIPVETTKTNEVYLKEFEETTKNRNKFKQYFESENYSYLNKIDKKETDIFNRRIGHLCGCIAWLCSEETNFSIENRLTNLEFIYEQYQDLIPPIYLRKLNSEVRSLASILESQVQKVNNRFEENNQSNENNTITRSDNLE